MNRQRRTRLAAKTAPGLGRGAYKRKACPTDRQVTIPSYVRCMSPRAKAKVAAAVKRARVDFPEDFVDRKRPVYARVKLDAKGEPIGPVELSGLGRLSRRKTKTKRCSKAPKKLTKRCTEAAFKANIRHNICVAGTSQAQALAIAFSVLERSCGVKPRTRKSPKQAIALAKRKRAR